MGELIRSFSDPRIGLTTISNNRFVDETLVSPRSPSESSNNPEYDISMEDLPPVPANPPAPFRHFRDEISMYGKFCFGACAVVVVLTNHEKGTTTKFKPQRFETAKRHNVRIPMVGSYTLIYLPPLTILQTSLLGILRR
jgi:hypothetical protein